MGNNPSIASKPSSTPPGGSTHPTVGGSNPRREPKLRDNIQSQRIAAPPEPSLAQARGINITHRSKVAQSQHSYLEDHGLSPKDPSPSQQSKSELQRSDFREESSKPVAVPISSNTPTPDSASLKSPFTDSQVDASGPLTDTLSYHLTRPPRLPLPIEEEVHTPGSPILAPSDSEAPLPEIQALEEADGQPSRSASALSSTTAEDDEDTDELPIDKTKPVVPTEFVWRGGGEKCYVTGTIFQWSRKSKLYPVPGKPGVFSAIIHVRPGTHHIRFLIDGNMTISQDLPTTVDFGNNLVNYIEVSADDLPAEVSSTKEEISKPVASGSRSQGVSSRRGDPETEEDNPPAKPSARTKHVLLAAQYSTMIPQYLLDLEKPEDSTAYQFAAAAVEKLPTPPSLPGFLGKPILNAATPMKDDNSVLNMPNHTVLNHLATSSIKNNVLAVSATTRYKRKYVTTIMYKPTSDDTN